MTRRTPQDAGFDDEQAWALIDLSGTAAERRELKTAVVDLTQDIAILRTEMQGGFARLDARVDGQTDEMNARFKGQTDEMNAKFKGQTDEMNAKFKGQTDEANGRFDDSADRALLRRSADQAPQTVTARPPSDSSRR